tara:strand:- start:135431 stop:135595 length:165 start_codon:yes stop_codon:yes gene_type:complete
MDTTPKKISAILLFCMVSMLGLSGCDQDGPVENFGEEVDEAAQDAKRKIEDATD